jgi:hypothetical protein
MAPLQRIAMGMVIVAGFAPFQPDPSPSLQRCGALLTELVAGLVNVAFIYFVFPVHRREWLGGLPLAGPRAQAAGERGGRPPSS